MKKTRKIKKIEPYTKKWERLANDLARTWHVIKPCKECGYPVTDCYCCGTCGCTNP